MCRLTKWIALVVLGVAFVVSCVEVRIKLKISRDGSGTVEGTLVPAAGAPSGEEVLADIKQKLLSQGWSAEPTTVGTGRSALRFRRNFKSLGELGLIGITGDFTSSGGIWKKSYATNLTFGGSGQAALFELQVSVPGSIRETNGVKVASDTVKWDLTGSAGVTRLIIKSSGLAIPGPLVLARSLAGAIDARLERASATPLLVYGKDGYVWAASTEGGTPKKLWPDSVESFTVSENGFVALEPKTEDRAEADVVVVSASKPAKTVLKIARAGFSPAISPNGRQLAYVKRADTFSKEEIEQARQPQFCLSTIFVPDPGPGVFQQMEAQQRVDTIARAIEAGADYSGLHTEYWINSNNVGGCARASDFPEGLGARLMGHKAGEIIGPVKVQSGWYFLRIQQVLEADASWVPPKKTTVVLRDLGTGQERDVTTNPKMVQGMRNWHNLLQGWTSRGTALRVILSYFPAPETETPRWLWIPTRDVAVNWADEVLANDAVVEVGDGGEFAAVTDISGKKLLSVESLTPDWGGPYAVSPSGMRLVFVVTRRPKNLNGTDELRAWLGSGESFVLDRVEGHDQDARIADVRWTSESEVVYSKREGDASGFDLWRATVPEGRPTKLFPGSRPLEIPGEGNRLVFARGTPSSTEWWVSGLDGSGARAIVSGIGSVVVTRTVGIGASARRVVAYSTVSVLALGLLAAIGFAGFAVAKRARRRVAAKLPVIVGRHQRFCRACGAELDGGTRYCRKCGQAVESQTTQERDNA